MATFDPDAYLAEQPAFDPDAYLASVKESPAAWQVGVNAVNKGIANTIDMLLNAPQNVANLARAGVGTAAIAAGRPDLAPELRPTPDLARRAFTALGGIRPEFEPSTTGQRVLDVAGQGIGGGVMSPAASLGGMGRNVAMGGVSGATGQGTTEATGSPLAGMLASMTTPSVMSAAGNRAQAAINQARLQEAQQSLRNQTLRAGQEAGYMIPPSTVNPSAVNKILESVAGKAAVGQEVSLRNQEITNRLMRQELGLPEGAPITEKALSDFRARVSQPYQDIAAISPLASSTLDKLKDARFEAKAQWNYYNRSADPKALKLAKEFDDKADMLETALEKIAAKSNQPQLVDDLREARKQIAKSYNIENALNIGTGNISAPILARQMDKGTPFTGNLATTGRFANAFPSSMREGERIPTPGVSAGNALASAILGTVGGTQMGAPGALAAALPYASIPARALVTSPAYQRMMAQPNYSPGMTNRALAPLGGMRPEEEALLSALAAARQQGANQ